MREDDMLRLSLQCSQLVVAGAPYESTLADGVAAIMRTDAGTGVTSWDGTGGSAVDQVDVVVSGVAPFTIERKKAAMAVAAKHPTLGGRGWSRGPTHRVSDLISLPAFWDTEVWHVMHGHGNGRYPAAVLLAHERRATVFVGVHRVRRDFDADDMAALDLLRQPLAAALAFRAEWHHASVRCRAVNGHSEPLTPREEQVIGLVALGWTNDRIARHLQIGERTVRKHLENINDKFGTINRAAAVHQWDHAGRTHDDPIAPELQKHRRTQLLDPLQ